MLYESHYLVRTLLLTGVGLLPGTTDERLGGCEFSASPALLFLRNIATVHASVWKRVKKKLLIVGLETPVRPQVSVLRKSSLTLLL